MKNYLKFGGMIATSTIVMYMLTYMNTYELGHVYFSETRLFMSVMMGAAMALVMLGFMLHMLQNTRINIGILVFSILVFTFALFLVRSQTTIGEISYMKAMIPHHSIAILTSERANIEDPRVRELADEIIEAQREEIEEMKLLIHELQNQ
jgi:Ca2+/Na+ antiporter